MPVAGCCAFFFGLREAEGMENAPDYLTRL
jgi:hypothetical protein